MHDPLKQIDRLAALARQECVPETQVAGAVMARLRMHRRADRSMSWFALGATVAAAAVVAVCYPSIEAAFDPLGIWLGQGVRL